MTSKDHEVPALLHLVAALFQREFPSQNWFNIMSPGDREFSQKLAAGERELSSWLASEYPENESPKGGNFSKVEQMAVIAQRRPDRFAASVSNFISRIADLPESGLGAMEFISQVGGAATPKLFILSGGADPTNDIAGLAEAQGQALVEAALEEDNDATFAVFKECLRSGKWLLLKNCHLASSWLEKLEGDLAAPDIHEDFRLWLTSESVPSFSPAILRRSMKMCVEAPPGLRRSMERISDLWPSRMSSDHLQLALLHSLILERKGFGSLGWSQEYDFTVADIRAALAVSAKMRNRPGITEKMLEGVIYGSRMHNPFDGNLLKLMVNETMSREGPSFGKFPKMISVKSKADALSYTAKLPASRNSDHLGLAKNSGKALAEHLVRESIRSLNLLARQTEHADSQWESAAANVVKHFQKLFSRSSIEAISSLDASQSSPQPIESFLIGEKRLLKSVFKTVNESINSMEAALRGSVTSKAKTDAQSILDAATPSSWARAYSDGPEEPIAFLDKLAKIMNYLISSASSSSLNVSMMFRPSALIAALQLHENAPANAVLSLTASGGKLKVAGMVLSGADFRSKLSHADINTKSTVELPPMGVTFVAETSAAMPLYSDQHRENLICPAILSGLGSDASPWLLSGAALFLSSV